MPGYVDGFFSGDILVDQARGRIYLTAGKYTGDVMAVDLDAGNPRKIGEVDGGAGMALSPDGKRLYIAASAGPWVATIDTTTFEAGGQVPATVEAAQDPSSRTCPQDGVRMPG
jgi:sugar lactone lactonase YvrE